MIGEIFPKNPLKNITPLKRCGFPQAPMQVKFPVGGEVMLGLFLMMILTVWSLPLRATACNWIIGIGAISGLYTPIITSLFDHACVGRGGGSTHGVNRLLGNIGSCMHVVCFWETLKG